MRSSNSRVLRIHRPLTSETAVDRFARCLGAHPHPPSPSGFRNRIGRGQPGCRRAGGIRCRPRRYFRSAWLRMRIPALRRVRLLYKRHKRPVALCKPLGAGGDAEHVRLQIRPRSAYMGVADARCSCAIRHRKAAKSSGGSGSEGTAYEVEGLAKGAFRDVPG